MTSQFVFYDEEILMDDNLSQIIAAFKYYYSPEFVGPRQYEHTIVIDSFAMIAGAKYDTVILDDLYFPPTPVEVDWRGHEPLPRPPKDKPFIKQAPRQSFRQSMRSVNRNR